MKYSYYNPTQIEFGKEQIKLISKFISKEQKVLIVYGGGVALNCLANRLLGDYFENIWIMPNPGDAGSSLGAAALGYGKRLNWTNAYSAMILVGITLPIVFLIVLSLTKLWELLVAVQNSVPEHLETEVSLQTPEVKK